jgi:acetyl esterase/lipase
VADSIRRVVQRPSDVDIRTISRPELAEIEPVTVFPGVISHLDVQYAGPLGFRPLTLDLHLPRRETGAPLPVAVYAHPGGFLLGTRRFGPWRFLLDAGIAVASVSYRLSGEAVFPAPVHDVAAAIRWVRHNAGAYGLDPGLVIGFGSSAGAYLVSAVALMGDDPELVGALGPVPGVSCRVAAVVEHYAPTDILRMDDDAPDDVVELMVAPGSTMAKFLGFSPADEPERTDRARLTRYAKATAPPFLIVHGDDDHRVGIEQSRRLHRALNDAGAHAELLVLPGADHGSPNFDQPDVHEATLAFLKTRLKLSVATPRSVS